MSTTMQYNCTRQPNVMMIGVIIIIVANDDDDDDNNNNDNLETKNNHGHSPKKPVNNIILYNIILIFNTQWR